MIFVTSSHHCLVSCKYRSIKVVLSFIFVKKTDFCVVYNVDNCIDMLRFNEKNLSDHSLTYFGSVRYVPPISSRDNSLPMRYWVSDNGKFKNLIIHKRMHF